jgi:NADPH:quinone reductase-like Zn-dependent oxidoreductase
MKAVVLESINQPLVYKEIPKPIASYNEVIVKLKAASVNHRDVWIQKGLYPGIKSSVVLGSDGAGIVESVGENVDPALVGTAVIINPSHDWGNDPSYYGEDYKILGLPDDGTFSEYVKVNQQYVYPKPEHLSFEEAAALPMAGLTAWRALISRGGYRPGEKVLITGTGGGVSLFALKFALEAGAEVWVTSGSDEKIRKAVGMGAKGGINYKDPAWYRDLLLKTKSPRGGYFNVIIDSAGGPGFTRLIDVAAAGGRICFYGGTAGVITNIVPARVFFKQLSLLGCMMGNEKEFIDMLTFVNEKQIKPTIDSVFPLNEVQTAFQQMESDKRFGKVILKIED